MLYEVEGPLAIVTVNRPAVRNAISRATMEELAQAIDAAEGDEEVRVLILTGAGEKAFIAGADINEIDRPHHPHRAGSG